MNRRNMIFNMLREIQKKHKIPDLESDPDKNSILNELLEKGCVHQSIVRHSAIMADPNDKSKTFEKEEYVVNKELVKNIYDIDLPIW